MTGRLMHRVRHDVCSLDCAHCGASVAFILVTNTTTHESDVARVIHSAPHCERFERVKSDADAQGYADELYRFYENGKN